MLVYKSGKVPPSITWTAVADGTASTSSTKITFTFTPSVSDLEAGDITLTNGTGSAAKGDLTGSGTTWTLGITVNTAGTVSVKVTKENVSATAQNVTVRKVGGVVVPTHPISGRTSWVVDANTWITSQITFSTISGTGGTFELKSVDLTDYDNPTWSKPQGEGTYTWNGSAETVTLTLTKIGVEVTDPETYLSELVLMTQSEVESVYQTTIEAYVDEQIAYYMEESVWDDETEDFITVTRDEEEAEEYFLEMEHLWNGKPDYSTKADYIAGELAIALEVFNPRLYTYILVNNGATLILLEALPASVGSDELAGKTFNIAIPDMEGGYEKDENTTFAFVTGGTFTATSTDPDTSEDITVTGTYSYNSTTKQVYLKPGTLYGQTPEEFFDATELDPDSNYPTEADDRAAQTNQNFQVLRLSYDLSDNVLIISGGISGL